jgi:hypothetical protein
MDPYPAADLGRFVLDLARFAQFTDQDAEAVRRTASLVLEHEPAITAAVYEHFLAWPESARFFLQPDGTPDAARLERRKHSLGRWLRQTAEAALEPGFFYGILGVGLAHSHRSYGPGGVIPPELVVGAMSLTQSTLAGVLAETLPDGREALLASIAWNKLLLIHLNVLLLGYLTPWREAQARSAPRSTVHD